MNIAIINDYNKNCLLVLAASPHSWAHMLALNNISGNFVVSLSICTVRKCLIPKKNYTTFILVKKKNKTRHCRYHFSNLTRPASSQKEYTQGNAWWMHCDTLCSLGPNCAQLMNVNGKGNHWTFVKDFPHFALWEYTALLHGFYKQNYVFGKCL